VDGPGECLPNGTEGITRIEDLPKAKVVKRARNYKRRQCPQCGHSAYPDRVFTRILHDLGDMKANLGSHLAQTCAYARRTHRKPTREVVHLRPITLWSPT